MLNALCRLLPFTCRPEAGLSPHAAAKKAAIDQVIGGASDGSKPKKTLVAPHRLGYTWDAVERVNSERLDGDVVECGVFMGGASMVMAWAQLGTGTKNRSIWLFDTFEGMPAPIGAKDDGRAKGRWASMKQWDAANESALFNGGAEYVEAKTGIRRWNYGPMSLVKANVLSTGFNPKLIHLTKGKVEDTLYARGRQLPARIAVLRLDTDWYDSTRAELDVLFPRLVPGGALIIDDYCSWAGARKAMDEFLEAHRDQFEPSSIVSSREQEPAAKAQCFSAIKKRQSIGT